MDDVDQHRDQFHECPPIMTLSEYVDGRIGPSTRDRIDRHLSSCQRCREDVAEFFAVIALLHEFHEPSGGR